MHKRIAEQSTGAQVIAAPANGPDIFNIVADWDDIVRYRHRADGLSKAGWTTRQVENALGGSLMRVYGESFG
jgi:membrane dipeptidase